MTRKLLFFFFYWFTFDVIKKKGPKRSSSFHRVYVNVFFCPSGGNQRDLARDKAAKKAADLQKSKSAAEKEGNKGLSLEARKQRYLLLFCF